MRRFVLAVAFAAFPATAALAQMVSPAITEAVKDSGRPAVDTARDADRKPAESVAFSRMKPGDKVADFLPGGGYYTRIFSKVVGAKGHVYAVLPAEFAATHARSQAEISAVLPAYSANTELLVTPYDKFGAPEKLDIAWTSLNYHDLHNASFAVPDINAFNKAVFNSLKPGGIFIVIDYIAKPGSGFEATQKLHRVDVDAVKKEVEAAGFVLDGESNILHNSSDDHTLPSGSATKDKSDEFLLRFKKPG